jgi:mannose-6-phosphate isomerase
VVQHYAWGDTEAIPALLRREPDGQPWAEWWLGTHAGGPSTLADGSALSAVAGELPYLMKVLAAAEPLSLQTHPSAAEARAGFNRENSAGISPDSPARIYRDPNAKPEVLCALTPFDTLCGFRPVQDTAALLHALGAHETARALLDDGLAATVGGLYRGTIQSEPLVRACDGHPSPQAELVTRLDGMYPGEPSVAVTLFLNRVRLLPGEAIYLTPGNLHAYLHGVGVEVMGASDNVVRGGLTVKHVDVDELLRVLEFDALPDPVVVAHETDPGSWHYPTPDAPFTLRRLDIRETTLHTAEGRELALCTAGDTLPLLRGQAAYLAPGESIELHGPSTVWVVGAP